MRRIRNPPCYRRLLEYRAERNSYFSVMPKDVLDLTATYLNRDVWPSVWQLVPRVVLPATRSLCHCVLADGSWFFLLPGGPQWLPANSRVLQPVSHPQINLYDYYLAADPVRGVWLTSLTGTLIHFDPASQTILQEILVGGQPLPDLLEQVIVTPDRHFLLVDINWLIQEFDEQGVYLRQKLVNEATNLWSASSTGLLSTLGHSGYLWLAFPFGSSEVVKVYPEKDFNYGYQACHYRDKETTDVFILTNYELSLHDGDVIQEFRGGLQWRGLGQDSDGQISLLSYSPTGEVTLWDLC